MVKILVKWSKTIQTRDHIKVITLPRLVGNALCPYMALKALFKLYNPSQNAPLFQYKYSRDWKVLIDSKIRKVLSLINKKLHLSPHFFTFHAFRRSGASLAFNANVPIQEIKVQGTWTSDCYGGTFTMTLLVRLKSPLLFKKCFKNHNVNKC